MQSRPSSLRDLTIGAARPSLAGVAGLALVALSGCTSGAPGEGAASELRLDPTPEAYTLHQRPEDVSNEFALMWDENSRMLVQDWHRAFFWDRPSRLTREPVPR